MRLAIILLIATFAFPLRAVDVAPVQKRDTPIVIKHEAGQTINAVFVDSVGAWKFLPDSHFMRGETQTVMAGPPGQYLITAGDSSIVQIIEEGQPDPPKPKPRPKPKPDPNPEPEPDPQPDGIRAEWLVFLEEQEERAQNPAKAQVITDAGFRQTLADIGLKVRVYDDDQEVAKPFLRVAGTERPVMILVGDDGKTRVFAVPESIAQAEQLIRGAIIR